MGRLVLQLIDNKSRLLFYIRAVYIYLLESEKRRTLETKSLADETTSSQSARYREPRCGLS